MRSRSSKLTGGEGYTYEDLVVAYYLTALLREELAMGTRGTVSRVAIQQDRQGEPMDDLVVDAEESGETSRLSLQVKSGFVISAKDSDFKAIISTALATRKDPKFSFARDRYGFVVDTVAVGTFDSLGNILARAQASTNGAEFASRFTPKGESSRGDIDLRDELKVLIKPTTDDEEWDFYYHFVAYRFDNIVPGGDRHAELANRLGEVATIAGAAFAEIMARHVRSGQGSARVWDRNTLIKEMRPLVGTLCIAPSYGQDINTITELAKTALADIRDDIAGISVERAALVAAAEEATSRHRFTNVSGLPGCGKSVVLRRVVERALTNGPVIFLKSDRLEGSSWLSFASHHGLFHRSPNALLGEIAGSGTPTLFIDGIDRIKTDQRGVVTDLLRAIESDPQLASWRVLVTSRDQGLEVMRSWIPSSLWSKGGLGNVDVGVLTDGEANDLADKYPALTPLLSGAQPVQEIARRPFFAAVLADQASSLGFDAGAPPQTESELIEAWWRAGGYNVEPDNADGRQRAMLDLAERGAPTLGKEIRSRNLEAPTVAHLAGLRRDKVIDAVETGTSYKFTHDIFFEWAYFRLLVDKGADWPDALVAAGEPPLLARIVGLLAQHDYEGGKGWDATFSALSGRPLRPQWRRSWLLGPTASPRFLEHQVTFESMLYADDQALLEKFLVWFQAERTIPSPAILQSVNPGIRNSLLVRAADYMGWPSDVPAWQRVLLWLIARHSTFSSRLIPHVVELFSVWQNMLADVPNGLSQQIVGICATWLEELETGSAPERWKGLPKDSGESLAGELRKLILRAARAYPEPAGGVLDRLATWERRSGEVLKSVFGLSIVLSQVHPGKLAELVRIEVLDELPKDEFERERRERDETYARLKAIRDKPEEERTGIEKRMVSAPHYFSSMGNDRYDFDRIGIDRGHTLFYPPAPSHEPFDALFEYAPDVARGLVRDIANHAITGWLQVHEMNRRKYGTPLPIEIDFGDGKHSFWGDQRVYSWFVGQGGPQPVDAAFLALGHWVHKQLDAGADLDALMRKVVEGHRSVAALGLAVSLAIEKCERTPTLFAVIKSQRLWVLDFVRQVQEGSRGINLFGLDLRDRMNEKQRAGDAYLMGRTYRQSSLKDLACLYALSDDEGERTDFDAVTSDFPNQLPFEFEEHVGHPDVEAELRERAVGWAEFGKKDNYGLEQVPNRDDALQVVYRDPTPKSEAQQERIEESRNSLGDFNVVAWASESLKNGKLDSKVSVEAAVAFAKSRDHDTLFNVVDEAGKGFRQSCVAAVSAVVIRFDVTPADFEWAWSIVDRMDGLSEPEGPFRYSNDPLDPRIFRMVALKADLSGTSARPASAERLLRYAADLNPHIAEAAFAGLLDASALPTATVWNAAILASELFAGHFPAVRGEDDVGQQAKDHREAALCRALSRMDANGTGTLVPPPPAWEKVVASRRGRMRRDESDEHWTFPTFDFNPQFAARIAKRFPIERWIEDGEHRDAILIYVEALVAWTAERMFPSFAADDDKSSQLYEWLDALSQLVARVLVHVPPPEVGPRFMDPILKHDSRNVLQFADELTDQITRRHVYDAAELSPRALQALDLLMTRMLAERNFSPRGYRPGEIRDRHLDTMLKSFLLISATDCPDAARFANGAWDELPTLMPQINRLMAAVGWADSVADKFLTLSERAAATLAIEDFARIVDEAMDAEGFRLERWNSAGIPASISGAIQGLAIANYPLTSERARMLLLILDRLVDIGDRRAAALQQSEHFRGIQIDANDSTISAG